VVDGVWIFLVPEQPWALKVPKVLSWLAKLFEPNSRRAPATTKNIAGVSWDLLAELPNTLWGASVIPQRWLRWLGELDLRDVIATIATDLVTATGDTASLESRYPGW